MKNLSTKYSQSVTWSIIESVAFQGLLVAHQYALFKVLTPLLYGYIGTIFGLIYLTITICDMGLYHILSPFYHHYSKDKNSFLIFIKKQMVPNVLFFISVLFVLFVAKLFFHEKATFLSTVDYPLLIIIALSVAIEMLKKIIKRFLHLAYIFKKVTFFEISFLLTYQIIIWFTFWWQQQLNIHFIFGSFCLISLCETIGILFILYAWYTKLPSTTVQKQGANLPHKIVKNRLWNYVYQLSKQLLSANMLVPLFAYFYGFESAALLKIASYYTHSITCAMEKIIGPTSSVLFAHIKCETNKKQQKFFSLVSTSSFHILICSYIFIIINFTKLVTFSHFSSTIFAFSLIYFLIHFLENFFLPFESFYITHERSDVLLFNTLCTSLLVIIGIFYYASPLATLLGALLSRFISFVFLYISTRYFLSITPQLQISLRYIFSSVLLSSLFFLIF